MKFKQFGALLSISTILGINVVATEVLAQVPNVPSITFGNAIAAGGCKIVGQLPGNDGKTLAIILDQMNPVNGQRKRCILRINTTIPAGFRIQEVEVLYRGSVEVLPRSRGVTFSRSYSLTAGNLGIVVAQPEITEFVESEPLFQEEDGLDVLSATCGGARGQLGINMVAQTTPGSTFTLDSADLAAARVLVNIPLRRC